MKSFCSAPAASQNHHNYIGGLLEHTLTMMQIGSAVLPFYPDLQRDLVIAGLFLHDIGKTQELAVDISINYTDAGQLLGHITQGAVLIAQKADALKQRSIKIDEHILNHIIHIVLSHHGQYEYGSPKLPATAEAFFVAHLDNLDAKINLVSSKIENDSGDSDWTAYISSIQSKIYKKHSPIG